MPKFNMNYLEPKLTQFDAQRCPNLGSPKSSPNFKDFYKNNEAYTKSPQITVKAQKNQIQIKSKWKRILLNLKNNVTDNEYTDL